MKARRLALRIILPLLFLASLLVVLVPSASATGPYTCGPIMGIPVSSTIPSTRPAGPNVISRYAYEGTEYDQCLRGTWSGEVREIDFATGDFVAKSVSTFTGGVADETGAFRYGTLKLRLTMHLRGGILTIKSTAIGGTGDLANLHLSGFEVVDFTADPVTDSVLYRIHFDP